MEGDSKLALIKLEIDQISRLLDEAERIYHQAKFELNDAHNRNSRLIRALAKKRKSKQISAGEARHLRIQIEWLKRELGQLRNNFLKAQTHHAKIQYQYDALQVSLVNRLIHLKNKSKQIKHFDPPGLDSLGDVLVDKKPNGTTHVFFGGVGGPLGEGHGHYVYAPDGQLVYRRDPFTPRGRQNHLGPFNDGLLGGFERPQFGYIDGEPYSLAYGWGTRKGYSLVAKGHLGSDAFRESNDIIVYGPNQGPLNDSSFIVMPK